ncbi:amino acid ABC transporter substrate-binding protein [Chloroflexota bacterium]
MENKNLLTLVGSFCLILVLAVLPFMAACAKPAPTPTPTPTPIPTPTPKPKPEAPKTIKLGAAPPLSGPLAAGGNEVKQGYELAVEAFNKAGGVYVKEFDKNIPLELILYDCETDPVKAVSKYETLNSSDHVVAYLGAHGSSIHAAAAAVAEKNKIPYLGVAFALWGLHQKGYKYLFSPFIKTPDIVPGYFDFLESELTPEARPHKIANWELQTDWGIEMAAMVREIAPKYGYEIVSSGKYTFGTKDFSPLILEAKAAGADLVWANPIPPVGIAMVKQMKELDYNPLVFVITRAADTWSWTEALGKDGDYVLLMDIWNYNVKYPGSEEFIKGGEAKYGHLPEPISAPAYSCVEILADAIERAGTLDSTAIRDAVATTDMMTIIGPIKFGEDGTLINPTIVILQWQDGKQPLLSPKEWATARFVYPAPKWKER